MILLYKYKIKENYSLNNEIYEKELKLKDMYFGVSNKIPLKYIYSEVQKLSNSEEIKFIDWKLNHFLRIQKELEATNSIWK